MKGWYRDQLGGPVIGKASKPDSTPPIRLGSLLSLCSLGPLYITEYLDILGTKAYTRDTVTERATGKPLVCDA
jgi:hypothetical protein